jgi:imidazolonepropionase
MPLVIGLAVRLYGWSVLEALLAATLNAAWVLRRSRETGSLEVGKRADVLVLDGPLERIPYRLGHNPVALVFAGGRLAHVRPDCAWRVAGLQALA